MCSHTFLTFFQRFTKTASFNPEMKKVRKWRGSGGLMCACLVVLSLSLSVESEYTRSCLPHEGDQTRTNGATPFFNMQSAFVSVNMWLCWRTLAGVTSTLTLNYVYLGVVRGIKNALDSRAIMIALPVVNNTYLMQSNTDYCKLFNCILIPQDPVWREGDKEIVTYIKQPLSRGQVCLPVSKQHVTTEDASL